MSDPASAPSKLLTQNAAFASSLSPDALIAQSAGQSPSVFWLGCCDSRVPESVLCGVGPGEIFVHRNIANIFNPHDDSAVSALTYAVAHLGVSHVVIVGHTLCGGSLAALSSASSPPSTASPSPLSRWLAPLRSLAVGVLRKSGGRAGKEECRELVEENVCRGVGNVIEQECVREAWAKGRKLEVHGWVYELETGKLVDLGITKKGPQ